MEGDSLGLDFALLDVDFVAREDDGHVFAHADEVAVPVRDVLVGDARGYVEHDDAALAVDVIAIAEAAEFFLASGVPDVELDATVVLGCGVRLILHDGRWGGEAAGLGLRL